MQDNNLRISFDYKYPDAAVLVVYESWGSAMWGGDTSIRVRKTLVGDEAIRTYALLSGRDIADICKEAGCSPVEVKPIGEAFSKGIDSGIKESILDGYTYG